MTTLHATPTLLRILLAAGWPGDGRVRVISAGEPLDPALARELLGRAGELWNAYGPTEATVIATMHRVTDASATSVPIGRPLPGVRTYVVDPLGRLCPPGAPGELWIGGAGVASGYRGRPELTAAVFGPDPFAPGGRRYRSGDLVRWRDDGTIDFIGRTDGQVKLRGYRIELGEVESVLREHPGIADAMVTVDGAGADARLVGYVVPGGSRDPVDPPALAGHARDRLAEYMVPRCWVVLDALPRLPSGKVDRAALPPPGRVAAGPAPDTATERLVAAVWAEVLDAPDIRTGDDFFALGGHSYAAVRTVGRLHQALGCRIPVRLLFDHPVLADFVVELESVAIAELRGAPAGADA